MGAGAENRAAFPVRRKVVVVFLTLRPPFYAGGELCIGHSIDCKSRQQVLVSVELDAGLGRYLCQVLGDERQQPTVRFVRRGAILVDVILNLAGYTAVSWRRPSR